jgi:hypothetical protein
MCFPTRVSRSGAHVIPDEAPSRTGPVLHAVLDSSCTVESEQPTDAWAKQARRPRPPWSPVPPTVRLLRYQSNTVSSAVTAFEGRASADTN